MGTVVEALDRETGRPVALKALRGLDGEDLFRLKQEFRALRGLAHPNLVRLVGLDVGPDHAFFTMEVVDGAPFVAAVRRGAGPGEALSAAGQDALRGLFRQLVEGLHALHRAGRVHRDIKSANVLVTREGRVVVLDLGLAAARGVVEPDRVVGTPSTMAPEQGMGAAVGPAADLFAVGVLLYEALTGERPFGGTLVEMLAAKQAGRFLGPAERCPAVAADLDAVVRALLVPDPAARATADVALALLGLSSPEVGPLPAQFGFVGRDAAVDALFGALRGARTGGPRVVVVHGPAGIGKTALVERFGALAATLEGAACFLGRPAADERVPFRSLDGLVDALSRRLLGLGRSARRALDAGPDVLRLFPVLMGVPDLGWGGPEGLEPAAQRAAAFRALAALFLGAAGGGPAVLVVDDAEAGDPDSAAALEAMCGAPGPLLVVLVAREPEEGPLLGRLGAGAARLELGPLGAAEAQRLVEAALGRGHPLAAAVRGAGGGVPGALVRAAQAVAAGRPPLDDAAAAAAAVAALSAAELAVLRLVAAADGPIGAAAVAVAAGLPDPAVAAGLVRQGLLRGGTGAGERLRLGWPAVGAVALAGAAAAEVDALRARLGAAAAAGPVPSPAAVDAAAAGLAFDLAAGLQAARARAVPGPEAEARLGGLLALAGRAAEAAAAFRAAVEAAPGAAGAADWERRAAEELLRSGRVAEGIEALGAVLARVGLRLPATPARAAADVVVQRAALLLRGLGEVAPPAAPPSAAALARLDACWAAAMGLIWVDPVRSAAFQARFARLALDLGEPVRVVRALGTEAAFLANEGGAARRARAGGALARARRLAGALGDPTAAAIAEICGAAVGYFSGRFDDAAAAAAAAGAHLDRAPGGVAWERTNCHVFEGWARAYRGELDFLAGAHAARLADARARGDLLAATTLGSGLPAAVHLAADAPERALGAADEAMALWSASEGFHTQHYMDLLARVHVDLYLDRPARAWARVEEALPRARAAQLLRLQLMRVELCFLRGRAAAACLLAAPGDPAAGAWRRALAAEERALAGEDLAIARGFSAVLAGAAARASGASPGPAWAAAAEALRGAGVGLWAGALEVAAGGAGPAGVRAPARFAAVWVPGALPQR